MQCSFSADELRLMPTSELLADLSQSGGHFVFLGHRKKF
jgi:hypothetical protein